ncbi:MAG TPA: ABC transporter substrate-binding protein [Pelagibacterium sp.]|uniref:ABC transporter substrate-binding protein n=1 Tax=Pelagibacterium sp. TaxID=1967288 RepID=UPI002C8D4213|nr:ABC transporter substrate-binding protein [Pelagibacterium sp.]HWJ87183.1 ABC transporter substrate-binding protein [Pelagibacterium sp.]
MKKIVMSVMLAAMTGASAVSAADLNVAMQDDPDILDPHRGNTFVGRMVFGPMCDALFDIDTALNIVPRLVADWSWSDDETVLTMNLRDDALFHDGTKVDGEAVKANLERGLNLPESNRKAELASIASIDVLGETQVAITLKAPDAAFLANLTDRAGMLVSPASFDTAGEGGLVCAGPYKLAERVQNDRIVMEKFDDHWEADNYHFDRVIYRPIPDTTVRLANLQSGDLDIIERPAPSDMAAIEADDSLVFDIVSGLGFYGINFNMGNGERSQNPINQDARLREALNLTIDRNVLNDVLGMGTYPPAYQPFSSASWAYNPEFDGGGRDIERAKELMAEAGHESVSFEILYANNTAMQSLFELVQAMASEAGFNISLRPTEFAAYVAEREEGKFDASQFGASGRIDPDGNFHRYLACGSAGNVGHYCNDELTDLLNQARVINNVEERKALYDQAQRIAVEDLPALYFYYTPRTWGYSANLDGFVSYPDGVLRLSGLKPKN